MLVICLLRNDWNCHFWPFWHFRRLQGWD